MKKFIKRIIRRLGYKVSRLVYRNDIWHLIDFCLKEHKIKVLLDVGANEGQFLNNLQQHCYYHFEASYSFEPIPDAYSKLIANVKRFTNSKKVQVLNFALGNQTKEASINVTPNSVSSSLLPPSPDFIDHYKSGSNTKIYEIKVPVHRFDEIYHQLQPPLSLQKGLNEDRCFLKLDVQGFERNVLDGFGSCLDNVYVALLECSLVESYQGRPLIGDMLEYMSDLGFYVVGIFPGYFDEQKRQLCEVDVVFIRTRISQ